MTSLENIWSMTLYELRNILWDQKIENLKELDILTLKIYVSVLCYNSGLLNINDMRIVTHPFFDVFMKQYSFNEAVSLISSEEPEIKEIINLGGKVLKIDRLIKDYFIVKVLGKGAFGKVYQVVSSDLKSSVAVKRIDLDPEREENDDEILQELKILERIKGNFSQYLLCYDYNIKTDNTIFIVTEYLSYYTTLHRFIHNEKMIVNKNFKKYKILFNNLSVGLRSLHSLDVVHRDIKPSNILINFKTFEIKYIDFGSSCLETDSFLPFNQKTIKTTFQFSDPFCNRRVLYEDNPLTFEYMKRADIYSLGMTIYKIIIGTLPYDYFETNISNYFDSDIINQIKDCKYDQTLILYSSFYDYNASKFRSMNDEHVDRLVELFNFKTSSQMSLKKMLSRDPKLRDYPY